ncbi:MAG: hypothetical protein K1W28_01610 [Lachnospiraceae bacterium]
MDKNKKPTVEELTAELAQEKAKNAHLKNLLDRALSEKAHFKRVLADHEEDEKKREQKDEARRKEVNDLRLELDVQTYAKRVVAMGASEYQAEEIARQMLTGDMESFHENIKSLIADAKKRKMDKAIQQFLANSPEIHAGNGDMEIEPAAVRFAKQYASYQALDTGSLQRFE